MTDSKTGLGQYQKKNFRGNYCLSEHKWKYPEWKTNE